MEGASEGENPTKNHENNNSNGKFNNSSEGQSKPKRQMKTPFQLETLEKAYALETYPSEAIRAELSEKLGLTDRQLQMWFCHRRLKDKKEGGPTKKQRKSVPTLPEPPIDDLAHGSEPGSDYGSGSGSGSSPFGHAELRNVVSRSGADDVPMRRRYYESPQSILELRAIACVEAQLGEPLREDGPVLGVEFDRLPPDAFGAPIVAEQQKRAAHALEGKYERHDAKPNKATPRALHEYPFLQDHSSIRSDAYGQAAQSHFQDSPIDGPSARASSFAVGNEPLSRVHGVHGHGHVSRVRLLSQQERQAVAFPSPGDDGCVPQRDSFTNVRVNTQFSDPPTVAPENSNVLSDGQINDSMLRMERKRKSEEARIAKEVEAHEIRIRKELEKQDILRRKNEERMRKEMERHDRERRKEEERLMRERQREEERSKREQKREIERREKFLQKEYIRAEKRRQKEELRKEREAVRRKAALEKATARRLAKESMELIEDEQLELMELAAASKGLSSIICIDLDTLQNLDAFRDSLAAFPPKSVQLKRPFAVQPWINSEENIGNFLMVWRFLITFADVLELWPFTLDEFVQAFHDYDSRLLGEIHVALLRLIIKDIEDVARTPSTGLGVNQNGAANPGGGHPQIVEGAYAWGFDIRNWQQHLNLLTWPEIFRQLALSAGFGPQLKKRSTAWSYSPDNDEGKGCQDAISNLRNGSAAENAFAIMQEKGLLAPRKSRHRLTPGTVKFAAFHVLSLEGNKGLTVLELADKIQKSGLRDLTTSKTPEASISVALTRDTKLFERIAPSTYRVRAAYRKDPADAEAILSAARKKIQSTEPVKKPRLADDRGLNPNPNPNGRAFAQRPGGANPVLSRFRVTDRDSESNDASRGGGYVPQPLQHQELVSQYKTALAELTFNSKPIITNLTIIAGESVHAAKAIAATVCGNIIEVSSEQKLPSLYLLDSIVKNIGRDYIKYFAARLPEVFCKAYRQVEPNVHQSMRHLFGTWKGVFPAQTLQMIEKELGFASTANGSSSGAATSRLDSQSQRPAHSIHVNPKYLERQRLQQPTRTKGMASDFSGAMANSIDDAERPDRVASLSAGRPWVDPTVKMHNMQRSNTDALSERVHEKNIGAEYGEYEYGSDLPRSSNLGIGRIGGKITEQGNDKPWYGGGSSVAETISSQRNGFNIKHGLTNYSAPKSANADPRLKIAPAIASRSSGVLSSSWKNSEEEEFKWDDMNSRLTDHGPPDISSNSRKDCWTSDDSEKLGFGGHFRKPKGANDFATTVDLDTSADPTEHNDLSALGHRMSSPWPLPDSHDVDGLTTTGTPVISSVHSERYASSLSGLSTSGDSSVARLGSRAQVASSRIGASSFGFGATSGPAVAVGKQKQLQSVRAASPSGQSLVHQHSPAPASTVHHPHHHLQSLAEQDYLESPSLPPPDLKVSQLLGKSDLGLHNHYTEDSVPISTPNVRLGSIAKSRPQDLHSSSSSIKNPSLPQLCTYVTPSTAGISLPDHSNLLAAETSGQSSTSSLLAAVMKTGILSDKSITGSLPSLNLQDMGQIQSESGVQPPLPSGPPPTQVALPGSKVASAPSSSHLSHENSPASSDISLKKVGHPTLPPSQPLSSSLEGTASANASTVVNNASDPISNLLSSLVAKGLISASKSESPTPVSSQMPNELQNQSVSTPVTSSVSVSLVSASPSLPVSSRTDDVSLAEPLAKTSAALPQSSKIETKNPIGIEFKPDKIREFHPSVIEELFDDLPHKCSICGLRLKLKERLERHLEWHALKTPESNGSVKASRRWYADSTNWVAGKAGPPLGPEDNMSIDKPSETMDNGEPMVPADESQCVCVICGYIFEDLYCQERDEWMFKGASYLSIPYGVGDLGTTEESVVKGPIVHANCIAENSLSDLGLASRIKLEKDA